MLAILNHIKKWYQIINKIDYQLTKLYYIDIFTINILHNLKYYKALRAEHRLMTAFETIS